MPAQKKCSYLSCQNNSVKRRDLTFHRFPIDRRAQEWILRSGNDDLSDRTSEQLHDKRLCSEHFSADAFIEKNKTGPRRLLKATALPKLIQNHGVNSDTIENSRICTSIISDSSVRDTSIEEITNGDIIEESIVSSTKDTSQNSVTINNSVNNIISKSTVLTSMSSVNIPTTAEKIRSQTDSLNRKVIQLKNKLKEAQRQIKNLKRSRRTRRVTVDTILNDIAPFLNDDQFTFIKMQFDHIKKREWTRLEQNFATSLFCVSQKLYKFLRNETQLTLPCIGSIRRWIKNPNSDTKLLSDT